jgi:hypothetical protein
MKTQYLESMIVEVDVCHKPLLKMSELLLLRRTYTRNTAERMEVERMILSSGEVGRTAPPYVLEVQ